MQFWTRATGVYGKPVWLRKDVLQLFYDDDNNELTRQNEPTIMGGHTAFTQSASIYSQEPLDDTSTEVASDHPETEQLRGYVPAFVQRVGTCYLVQANIMGFATAAGKKSLQALGGGGVLSSAMRWALSDYQQRFGKPPHSIVLHLDVNGTVSLGDVAGRHSFGESVTSLVNQLLKRIDSGHVRASQATTAALRLVPQLDDATLHEEYGGSYDDVDLVESISASLDALRTSVLPLPDSGTPGGSKSDALSPELTVTIRTNGVEAEAAGSYVLKVLKDRIGLVLSEEEGTLARYIVTHEDRQLGLFFHPVLLEKLGKSKSYDLAQYVEDLQTLFGISNDLRAWQEVSSETLKKSDPKFKLYLGLCESADQKPGPFSLRPPRLEAVFKRETWDLQSSKVDDYKLISAHATAPSPWWVGFDTPPSLCDRLRRCLQAPGA